MTQPSAAERPPGDRPATSRRRWVEGSTWTVGVVFVVAILVLVNYFSWKYPARFDWTSDQLFTLSPKSLEVVETLDGEVEATLLMSASDPLQKPTIELLRQYEAAGPLRVRELDPVLDPAQAAQLVERYQLNRGSFVVLDDGQAHRVLGADDLAEFDYSVMQQGQPPKLVGYTGEQAMTSALLELAEAEALHVVFTTGHGERSLDDPSPQGWQKAARLLVQENLEVQEWASLGTNGLPAETDLLVIAGPSAGFSPTELELFGSFVDGGGRILLLLEPALSPLDLQREEALSAWLSARGVALAADVAVDPEATLPMFSGETFLIDTFADHPVVRPIAEARIPVLVSLARSVRPIAVDGFDSSLLFSSRASGWGETGLDALDRVQRDEQDIPGPLGLGVVVERLGAVAGSTPASQSGPGRLVVIGDADVGANEFVLSQANPSLLINLVNWLLARETLVTMPPKRGPAEPLELTSAELSRMWWFLVAGVPLAAVALGVFARWKRRR